MFQKQMLPRGVHTAEYLRTKEGWHGKTTLTQHVKSAKLMWVYSTISTPFNLPSSLGWESF